MLVISGHDRIGRILLPVNQVLARAVADRCETTAKIVIFTSSNEIEISAFWARYRHSIGVLWFLGVLWTSGKVNCGHSDMSGECSQKIECSYEKKLVILV